MLKAHQETPLSNQPHDCYFKTVFSKKENIISFLNCVLAQDQLLTQKVLPLIDLESIKLMNTEMVSSTNFSKLTGDILLRVDLKNSKNYLYIFCEHQSSQDENMNLRLEEYKVQFRKKLMQIDKKLPYLLTICVWAMKKPYKGATSIAEIYNSDEEYKILENLAPLHVDFAAYDTLQLIQDTNPEVALIKRNLNNKQYLEKSGNEIIKALEEGRYQKNSIELLYLLHRIRKTEIDQYLGNYISKIPDKYKEIFMSAALYYKQEGRREGKREGKQEGLFLTAKNMLKKNTDIDFIREVTGLQMEAIRGLQVA